VRRRRKKGGRFMIRKEVSLLPPTVVGAGRGQLLRVKPGVALKSSALVNEEVIHVSVRARKSI